MRVEGECLSRIPDERVRVRVTSDEFRRNFTIVSLGDYRLPPPPIRPSPLTASSAFLCFSS